jgi:hypothetical protein
MATGAARSSSYSTTPTPRPVSSDLRFDRQRGTGQGSPTDADGGFIFAKAIFDQKRNTAGVVVIDQPEAPRLYRSIDLMLAGGGFGARRGSSVRARLSPAERAS